MPTDLTNQISALTVRAPAAWLQEVWSELRSAPATATADFLKKRLPATSNSDLAHLLQQILDLAEGSMSWEALGYGLQVSSEIHSSYLDTRQIEMLWSATTHFADYHANQYGTNTLISRKPPPAVPRPKSQEVLRRNGV